MDGDGVGEKEKWLLKVLRGHFDNCGCGVVKDLQVTSLVVPGGVLSTIYIAQWKEVSPEHRHSLVCKLLGNAEARSAYHLEMHFLNERFFFSELLPFLLGPDSVEDISQLFPKFHFSHRDDIQSLIALDNLTPLGYKTAQKSLDLKHATFALQALGKFHALSYVAKKRDKKQFHSFMERLEYPRKQISLNNSYEMITLNCVRHTISLFKESRPTEFEKYSRHFEELTNDTLELYGKLYEGCEPMSVLCHGDFKSENMMFKYDDHGNLKGVKLIDFQLLTYSSPAIDVFLILFLSISPEIWETNWDELLASYHEAMLQTVSRCLKCSAESLQEELGPEVFKTEFINYCHHGFYIANFFEPMRNLKSDLYEELVDAMIEENTSQKKLDPLFTKMNNSYSTEMKHHVTTMLERVVRTKFSS